MIMALTTLWTRESNGDIFLPLKYGYSIKIGYNLLYNSFWKDFDEFIVFSHAHNFDPLLCVDKNAARKREKEPGLNIKVSFNKNVNFFDTFQNIFFQKKIAKHKIKVVLSWVIIAWLKEKIPYKIRNIICNSAVLFWSCYPPPPSNCQS